MPEISKDSLRNITWNANLFFQHGESQYNLDGRIGGDALLSFRGDAYAKKLPELVRKSVGVSDEIWRSQWQCNADNAFY